MEPGRLVSNWVVHITSPPDGRYAPLLPGMPRKYKAVRALVLPVCPPATAAKLAPRLKARPRARSSNPAQGLKMDVTVCPPATAKLALRLQARPCVRA